MVRDLIYFLYEDEFPHPTLLSNMGNHSLPRGKTDSNDVNTYQLIVRLYPNSANNDETPVQTNNKSDEIESISASTHQKT